jgi:hypothetical protein
MGAQEFGRGKKNFFDADQRGWTRIKQRSCSTCFDPGLHQACIETFRFAALSALIRVNPRPGFFAFFSTRMDLDKELLTRINADGHG